MNIIIPIKQVPETSNVKMDPETGTMVREGVESIVNPLDLYAIEMGITLKERYGGKVTVLTMGPQNASKALKEAISMGCDDGILISSMRFSGSDTWATSYILSNAIKQIGNYDLILTGERATDGDTGQVGPGIASFLDVTLATYVSRIVEVKHNKIIIERLIEDGYETLEMTLPSLLTVVKEISYPRLPTLRGKQKAKKTDILCWDENAFDLNTENIGLKGSPTRVVKIETPKVTRDGVVYNAEKDGAEKCVDELIKFMKQKQLV